MKVRDVLKLLRNDGWFICRMKGSHRQLRHIIKPGLVTVAGHAGKDLPMGILSSILRQAGIK